MRRRSSGARLLRLLLKSSLTQRREAIGYNLHITRAQVDWGDDQHPINAEEWLNVVANDGTLKVFENDNDEYILTDWTPSQEPQQGQYFTWNHGRISAKYPSKSAFIKMLRLAELLGGRVLGDDGELYQAGDDYNPPKR